MKIVLSLTLGLIFSFSIIAMDTSEKPQKLSDFIEVAKKSLEAQNKTATLEAIDVEAGRIADLSIAQMKRSQEQSIAEATARTDSFFAQNQLEADELLRSIEQAWAEEDAAKKANQ